MIKRIPCLNPELEVHLLTYRELLPNGQIGGEVRWTADALNLALSILPKPEACMLTTYTP
jgi:hypothetical protein